MNILFLTYQGDLAGSTFSIAFLAKALAERGHNVYAGVRRESMLYELLEDSNVVLIPMVFKGRMDFANIRHIRDICVNNKIDIINAQSSKDRYTSIFAKKFFKLKAKLVHTRRQQPKSIGGLQNWFYKWGTSKVIVISNELKRSFVRMGFPEYHLHVIHNGIPFSRYLEWSDAEVTKLKHELNIDDEKFVIGCVSRLKNQWQIVKAVQLLNIKNIVLIFCGIEEKELPEVESNSNCNVMFRGNVPKEQILNYYKLFDVNILASTMDGFGLVLIEAMAMECPVIATNFGGIKDVVRDEYNGLLFNDGDIEQLKTNIVRIATENSLRAQLIEKGRDTALKEFTMESTARKYEELFGSL